MMAVGAVPSSPIVELLADAAHVVLVATLALFASACGGEPDAATTVVALHSHRRRDRRREGADPSVDAINAARSAPIGYSWCASIVGWHLRSMLVKARSSLS